MEPKAIRGGLCRWDPPRRRLGPEAAAFIHGISAVIKKRVPQSVGPSTKSGHRERQLSVNQPESGPSAYTESAGAIILDFPASATRKTKWLLISRRGHGIFVIATQTDEDRASLRPLSNLSFTVVIHLIPICPEASLT